MRKMLGTAVMAAGLLLTPVAARAQMAGHNMGNQPTEGVMFGVGAGLVLPLGNYSNGDNLGFHGLGLVQVPLKQTPIHLRADLMFGVTAHKSSVASSGHTTLIGGTVDAVYHIGERGAKARPYVLGGLGYFSAKESVSGISQSNIALGLGGGVLFGLGATMHGFAELRYMNIFTSGNSIAFIPLTVGLMFQGK